MDERRPADGIFQYHRLDSSGEAELAVRRMEARACEAASSELFEALVDPLLTPGCRVLELGCGSGALARRILEAEPGSAVWAVDKSEGMIAAARRLAEDDTAAERVRFGTWDLAESDRFPFDHEVPFDLVLSSVVVPYLAPREAESLVRDIRTWLKPGGVVAFVEQDLQTDALHFPDAALRARIFAKDERALPCHVALGLCEPLEAAGFELLPRRSFLWTEEHYGEYLRELLGRIADDALERGRIDDVERERWSSELERLAKAGKFYYGLVYHRIAGRRPLS
jgi:SAM-dependent methyltransferase